jgi:type I restriction enzyme S subunit
VRDISRGGRSGLALLQSADHFIDEPDLGRLRTKPIPKGSVLFAKIGEAIRQNHRVIAGCDLLVDNNAMAAIPLAGTVSEYLYHYLRTVDFYRLASATTVPALKKSDLERLPVPWRSVSEQRRIADVLDRAEALRAKRRATLAQLDTLTQSIFLDLFGDPIANPHRFPVRPLITLIDPSRPISYGILMPGPDQATGVKYVRVVDMKEGGVDFSGVRRTTEAISNAFRRSLLKAGDLLMSIRGHVGRFAVVPPELDGANITQDTARLAIAGASVVFVRECLRSVGFQRWMTKHTKGVAVQGINLGDVKQMPIIMPPHDAQEAFAAKAASVANLRNSQRASLAELDALFASLQHRAFRGEL